MAESSLDQTWQKAQDRLTEAAKQVEFNRKFKNSTELETWISDRKATGDSKWADNGLTLLNVVSKLGHVVAPGAELVLLLPLFATRSVAKGN